MYAADLSEKLMASGLLTLCFSGIPLLFFEMTENNCPVWLKRLFVALGIVSFLAIVVGAFIGIWGA